MEREARFYEKRGDGKVQCFLCPHTCVIGEGKRGVCGVRVNKQGTLYTMIYGEVSSIAMDPIEKKPLYHFYPGSSILSIGTVGCSFRCQFCQNYSISQNPDHPTETYTPEELIRYARTRNSVGIAYTYSEPLIWYEFVYDTCEAAREAGLKNVFVTNGYINPEPLRELLPLADAFNIDLKSFSEDFYRKYTGGKLAPVLKTIEEIAGRDGVVLEVTTLVIPGHNDSDEELHQIAQFLADISLDLPWHISRFVPHYKMTDVPPTPVGTLHRAAEIGYETGLRYVYAGNVPGDRYESTYCPNCGEIAIQRFGYHTRPMLDGNRCKNCGYQLALVTEG